MRELSKKKERNTKEIFKFIRKQQKNNISKEN